MNVAGYDTNLAAEYYVLSCLHRLGLTANLTLGNEKGVDVVVARAAGDAVMIEVKGVAKKYDWPANNLRSRNPQNYFVALVSFEGYIDMMQMPAPRVWIIPFLEIEKFKRAYRGRTRPRHRGSLTAGSSLRILPIGESVVVARAGGLTPWPSSSRT